MWVRWKMIVLFFIFAIPCNYFNLFGRQTPNLPFFIGIWDNAVMEWHIFRMIYSSTENKNPSKH